MPLHFYSFQVGPDDEVATIFVPGDDRTPRSITNTHPNFAEIKELSLFAMAGADTDVEKILSLLDVSETVAQKFRLLSDRVSVRAGRVYFDGDPIDNSITKQMLRFLEEDVRDWGPLAFFMEDLMANPVAHSREQLYDWMRAHEVTLARDGRIVFYKGVAKDGDGFRSINSGQAVVNGEPQSGVIPQNVGDVVEMPRSEVQHNPNVACAPGLHASTFEYAQSWAQGAMLEIHVSARDVVSVPERASKVRVCRYEVVDTVDAPYSTAVLPDDNELDEDEVVALAQQMGTGVQQTQQEIRDILDDYMGAEEAVSITYVDRSGNRTTREALVDYVDDYHVDLRVGDDFDEYRTFRLSGIERVEVV